MAPTPAQAALIDQISMKDLLQFFDERIAEGREWVVWYVPHLDLSLKMGWILHFIYFMANLIYFNRN